MSPDFSEILLAFNVHHVEYLLVGAHALAVYGHVRATKDLDVWVRPDSENAERVLMAPVGVWRASRRSRQRRSKQSWDYLPDWCPSIADRRYHRHRRRRFCGCLARSLQDKLWWRPGLCNFPSPSHHQ